MKVIFKIKNNLGEFISEEMNISEDKYLELLEVSKCFYMGDYSMHLPNGFIVIPPEILKQSILIIEKL